MRIYFIKKVKKKILFTYECITSSGLLQAKEQGWLESGYTLLVLSINKNIIITLSDKGGSNHHEYQ